MLRNLVYGNVIADFSNSTALGGTLTISNSCKTSSLNNRASIAFAVADISYGTLKKGFFNNNVDTADARITAIIDTVSPTVGTGLSLSVSSNHANPPVEALRVQSNGNVGIGTQTPQFPLDVNGNIRLGTGTTGNILFGTSGVGTTQAGYIDLINNTMTVAANQIRLGTTNSAVSIPGTLVVNGKTNAFSGWTSRTSAVDNDWLAVTYGNGLFVAVSFSGTGNRVMTSPDGITWTSRTSAADNQWYAVTYGNGLFVAVSASGTGNRVMTSPDGITWTSRTSASDNNWYAVTYGNGLFVAVAATGTGNRVMTSPDGITWTSRISTADNNWHAVTYGNGLFVAVAYSGTGDRVMTSPDGITWTSRISTADNNWLAVTYGNGLFVAVAYSGTGDRVMTSPDGITWTSRTSASDNNWRDVTYGNGLFVAVSITGTGNRVMTSPDGITWTSRTSAADNQWYGVTYGNGVFVAVSYTGSGNRVMTMKYPNILDIDVGEDYKSNMSIGTNSGIMIEMNWTSRTSAADNNWRAVTYGNGLFVAVSYSGSGNRVMTSPDGITWTSRTSAADNGWFGVTYGNGLFVAVSYTGTGNRVMTSPDGIIWTSRTSAANNSWYGVIYGNGLFVAVASTGSNNRVMTSPDGITWTLRTSADDNQWLAVTYGNGLFVAVSYSGTGNRVMTSPDGITWTSRTSAADNQWVAVTYGNGLFVAVASSGTGDRVMTSPDGITWTLRTSAADNDWWGVTYGNGVFVAVSNSGTGNRVMTFSISPLLNTQNSIAIGNNAFVSFNDINNNTAISNSIAIGYNSNASGTNSIAIGTGAKVGNDLVLENFISRASALDTNSWYAITNGIPSTGIYNGINLFVAISPTGSALTNRIMTSIDGINWTGRSVNSDKSYQAITYGIPAGQGLFIAFTSTAGSNIVVTSPDGITWTNQALSGTMANGTWRDATYGGGLFVAVSQAGTNRIMRSTDGITWTAISVTTFDAGQWSGVAYGNGKFVAVSVSGATVTNSVITSSDGITWASSTIPSVTQAWHGITYGKGLFVATGQSGQASTSHVMTSPDGITWTVRTTPSISGIIRISYGNGYFVAPSYQNNAIIISTDGINWTLKENPLNSFGITYGIPSSGLYAGKGIFVTIGDGATKRVTTAVTDYIKNSVAIGSGAVANESNQIVLGTGTVNINNNSAFTSYVHMNSSRPGFCLNNDKQLPSTVGSIIPFSSFTANVIGNQSYLNIYKYRHSAGNDWFSSSTRIQQMIDNTNQGYIEFNPPNANYGIGIYGGSSTSSYGTGNGITVRSDGRVGIGTSSTDTAVLTLNGSNSGKIINMTTAGGGRWEITMNDTQNANLNFWGNTGTNFNVFSTVAFIENDSANPSTAKMNFTGQHRCSYDETIDAINYEGLIVNSTGEYWSLINNYDNTSQIDHITINESLPKITLTKTSLCKSVFGVISFTEDTNNTRKFDSAGRFVSIWQNPLGEKKRVYVNSLGEGGIWVCNANGIFTNGDYITSSNVPGYGMVQDNGQMMNYTVGKITMDCDFNPQEFPVYKIITNSDGTKDTIISTNSSGDIITKPAYKIRYILPDGSVITKEEYDIKTANNDPVYIAAFVGCTYHCG